MNETAVTPDAGFSGSPASDRDRDYRTAPQARQSSLAWQQGPLSTVNAHELARGLAWFSIGLGVAELIVPRVVARICGTQGRHPGLIRAYGVREIATGLLILSQGRRPATAVWSRVAGDALDLATLAGALLLPGTRKTGVLFGAANVLGVAALDVACAKELSRQEGRMSESGAIRVKRSVTVNRPPEEVYRFWRDFRNLPRFMYHLQSVEDLGEGRSRWVTRGPAGKNIQWDAEIAAERPNEMIAWRSLEGSMVANSGSVHFSPRTGGRGTIVRVELEYSPPGGIAGSVVAMLFGEAPEQQLYDDLRRLKQVIETGEVLRSDGSRYGTGQIRQQPAQPASA